MKLSYYVIWLPIQCNNTLNAPRSHIHIMYCMQFCVLDLLRVNKIEEKFIRRFEIHRLRHCSRTMVNIRTVFYEQNNTEKKNMTSEILTKKWRHYSWMRTDSINWWYRSYVARTYFHQRNTSWKIWIYSNLKRMFGIFFGILFRFF